MCEILRAVSERDLDQETRPIHLSVSDHEKEGVGNRREGKKRARSSDDNYSEGHQHASYEKAPVRGGAPGLRGSRIRRGGVEQKT